jgi:hypothetical protein
MSSITSISVLLSPADEEKIKLEHYLSKIDNVCIGGSFTDDICYFDNPLFTPDDIMFKIEVRGFVQFYDIKNDVLAIFKDYKGDLKIKIFFDNLENLIYGEIDIHKDGKGVCKYLDEDEVSKILNDNDDIYYEILDSELEENGQIVTL